MGWIIGISVAVIITTVLGLYFLIVRGLSRYRSPDDDWAPIEAAFGRKFLSRTSRGPRPPDSN